MRPEDLRKIKKRIDGTLSNFRSIYGCYVNAAGEVVAKMEIPVLDMETEEREMYATLLKKVLSGTQDRNQITVEFPADKVESSDEHRLLMALKSTQLRDESMRDLLYSRIIENLDMSGESFVIFLAADTYDLRTKDVKDEEWSEESNEQFEYFLCSICPVKNSKAALQYLPGQQEFRGISTGTLLAAPVLGFMFPALDEGSADIYEAQYYTKSTAENHGELISALFAVENPPMAAEVQKETFNFTLAESLGGECSLDVVTSLQAKLSARAEAVKEERLSVLASLNRECCREYEHAMGRHETSMLVEEEVYIDDHGSVSVPNAGPLGVDAGAVADLIMLGEKLYTGYTREYIRAFVSSGEDLRGQIIKGKLTVESLPVFEYT